MHCLEDKPLARHRRAQRALDVTRTCRLCGARVYELDAGGYCGTCHHDGLRRQASHPEIERRIAVMQELVEKRLPLTEGVR